MGQAAIGRYRRWYEYERDAHEKVIRSLESVPFDRHSSPEYTRAVSIFAHMIAARRMWIGRLGILPPLSGSLFPEQPELEKVLALNQEVEAAWSKYLDQLDDEAIDRSFEYQSLDAGRFRSRIEDILAQLFGHSWYHRGQIAMLVRQAGVEPAATDLIYWTRESVPSAE
jgi:uncharacterized damage-inducible protein DinB